MSSPFVFKPSKKFIFNPRPKIDKAQNLYHEQKLSIVQKNFEAYKPVRPFNRFGKSKIANTGKIQLNLTIQEILLFIMKITENMYQQNP